MVGPGGAVVRADRTSRRSFRRARERRSENESQCQKEDSTNSVNVHTLFHHSYGRHHDCEMQWFTTETLLAADPGVSNKKRMLDIRNRNLEQESGSDRRLHFFSRRAARPPASGGVDVLRNQSCRTEATNAPG